MNDTFATGNADQESLETLVKTQALSVDLREAVMACLSGGESRRWTVLELVERFKNLGVCASRASVTAALAELGLELELSSWAPWRLLERGTEWILAPKSELVELLCGVRRLPLKRRAIFQRNIRLCSWSLSGTAKKEGFPKPGWGDPRAGGLFLSGRSLELWLDLLRSVQGA